MNYFSFKNLFTRNSRTVVSFYVLLAIIVCVNNVFADSLTLSESQKDIVKCIGSPKQCYQLTSGSYSVSVKLMAATLNQHGITLASINDTTPLNIQIGALQFTSTLSAADAGKAVMTATNISGIWTSGHQRCVKQDDFGSCTKNKAVIDNTVKIKANQSLAISMSGKRDSSDPDTSNQSIYTALCQGNDKAILKEEAYIDIGDKTITLPITINCTSVKSTTSEIQGTMFNLINMKIKAKLAADNTPSCQNDSIIGTWREYDARTYWGRFVINDNGQSGFFYSSQCPSEAVPVSVTYDNVDTYSLTGVAGACTIPFVNTITQAGHCGATGTMTTEFTVDTPFNVKYKKQ